LARTPEEKEQTRLFIQGTEDELAAYVLSSDRTDRIATHLASAQIALEDRRYEDAVTAADAVLAIDPVHAEATQIRTGAQEGLVKLSQRRQKAVPGQPPTPGQQVVTATPQMVPVNPTPQETAESIAQIGKLRINVHSEGPEASVRVLLKGSPIFNQTFRGKRAGILRKASPFDASDLINVPAGSHDFQIYVTPRNKAAEFSAQAGFFRAGETRSLDIRVSGSGEVSVDLN